jgi:hypothetical protein
LFCAPAATHASTSAVACAFDEGPLGGIGPPNHDRIDPLLLEIVAMQFGEPQSFFSPARYVYIALALFISL